MNRKQSLLQDTRRERNKQEAQWHTIIATCRSTMQIGRDGGWHVGTSWAPAGGKRGAQSRCKNCDAHATCCRAANTTLTPVDARAQALRGHGAGIGFQPSGIDGPSLTDMQVLLVRLKTGQLDTTC